LTSFFNFISFLICLLYFS